MMLLSSLLLSATPAAVPVHDGCSSKADASAAWGAESKDLIDTAVAAGSFGTLAKALEAGDLVMPLKSDGPFTVFAPTDDAFAALPSGTLEKLLRPENKDMLRAILTYHVVPGMVEAKDVVKLQSATTLNGQRVDVSVTDEGVEIDGATVTKTDIRCKNGIIHVIDRVIMPATDDIVTTAVEAGQFETLAAALKAATLVEALRGEGPFTVFAPTDDAFAALPDGTVANLLKPENKEKLAAILKLHVVPGRIYADAAAEGAEVASLQGQKLRTRSKDGGVFVGTARVVQADIEASNGVIHVIDSVLLPE